MTQPCLPPGLLLRVALTHTLLRTIPRPYMQHYSDLGANLALAVCMF